MIEWDYSFYTFIIGAWLFLTITGLWFTLIMPRMDRWVRRFFIAFFSVLLTCCFIAFADAFVATHFYSYAAGKVFLFLETLGVSLPIPMLTAFLVHCRGEDVRESRLMRISAALWLVMFVLLLTAQPTTYLYSLTPEGVLVRGPWFPLFVLPMISIFGAWFSTTIHKRQKNTSVINGILYCIETVVLLLVLLLTRHATAGGAKGAVPLVLLFGVSAMMMAAVNNVITSIIPMYMRNTMDSGLLAGVLDTFCYVGSTLSTALLGYIADRGSWNGVFLCLCVFGAAACALCWVSVLVAKRRKENEIVF